MAIENDKGNIKDKYPCLLCGGDHFMKEFPRCENISKFMKINPTPIVLTNPFSSQQQLIDHMFNQGTSSSTEEIRTMSSFSINLNIRIHSYEKPIEKKDENPSSDKFPSTSSPPYLSNGPLMIKKPNLDLIVQPPNATLRKDIFNPNS